ncbi:hypothetical protein GPECTOR_34g702 [Gonium pectorale]|uniref:Uncharacterized protein n=1 Tax=Gonium pectorale TaxID=33097 RepID=A0A150GCP4_GONPE|nr:hypothetical protein GPECTOR_34g702 [Gonium pectorale]|eukprot:KXZ47543.1 hypothetical protein GPECTOR_34g702 [Gonium pectorale]
MRSPTLGLSLALALFGGSPHLPLVAAPLAISVLIQETLGAWAALLGRSRKLKRLSSDSGTPRSPRAFRTQTQESILKQQTVRRLNIDGMKED